MHVQIVHDNNCSFHKRILPRFHSIHPLLLYRFDRDNYTRNEFALGDDG